VIHAHPELGAALPQPAGVQDADWREAVEQRHEQPGGGGYRHSVATDGGTLAVPGRARQFSGVDRNQDDRHVPAK